MFRIRVQDMDETSRGHSKENAGGGHAARRNGGSALWEEPLDLLAPRILRFIGHAFHFLHQTLKARLYSRSQTEGLSADLAAHR